MKGHGMSPVFFFLINWTNWSTAWFIDSIPRIPSWTYLLVSGTPPKTRVFFLVTMGTLNQTHWGFMTRRTTLLPTQKKRVRFLRCHMAVAYNCLSLIIYHVFSLETIMFQLVLGVEIPSSMKSVHQNIFHQILKHENISKVPKYFWRTCRQYLKGPQYSRRKFDAFPSSLPWTTKICHVVGLPKSMPISDGGSPPGLSPGIRWSIEEESRWWMQPFSFFGSEKGSG